MADVEKQALWPLLLGTTALGTAAGWLGERLAGKGKSPAAPPVSQNPFQVEQEARRMQAEQRLQQLRRQQAQPGGGLADWRRPPTPGMSIFTPYLHSTSGFPGAAKGGAAMEKDALLGALGGALARGLGSGLKGLGRAAGAVGLPGAGKYLGRQGAALRVQGKGLQGGFGKDPAPALAGMVTSSPKPGPWREMGRQMLPLAAITGGAMALPAILGGGELPADDEAAISALQSQLAQRQRLERLQAIAEQRSALGPKMAAVLAALDKSAAACGKKPMVRAKKRKPAKKAEAPPDDSSLLEKVCWHQRKLAANAGVAKMVAPAGGATGVPFVGMPGSSAGTPTERPHPLRARIAGLARLLGRGGVGLAGLGLGAGLGAGAASLTRPTEPAPSPGVDPAMLAAYTS